MIPALPSFIVSQLKENGYIKIYYEIKNNNIEKRKIFAGY